MMPLVSILLPCYNAEKYLKHALESILSQDYKNLEILCINDGSEDRTLEILRSYQERESRIKIINQKQNLGLIDSLNNACSFIKGEYFARMDADDYCPSDRISKQVEFLSKNNEYDLISSGYHYFLKDGFKNKYVPPIGIQPKALQFIALFSTPLTHAAALGKTNLIKGGEYKYDKNFPYAEDFELFSKLAWKNIKLYNLNESLYWVRLNNESVSAVYSNLQIETNLKILRRNLNEFLGVELTNEAVLKVMLNRVDSKVTIKQIRLAFRLFKEYFAKANLILKFNKAEKKEINNYLKLQTLNIILQSNKKRFDALGIKNFPFFLSSLSLLKIGHLSHFLKKIAP